MLKHDGSSVNCASLHFSGTGSDESTALLADAVRRRPEVELVVAAAARVIVHVDLKSGEQKRFCYVDCLKKLDHF